MCLSNRASQNDAIWYISRHQEDNGLVEMLKITPGVTVCKVSIQLTSCQGGSEATITYSHTSLGPDGDAFVASFTEERDEQFIRTWETRIKHYLSHGTARHGRAV